MNQMAQEFHEFEVDSNIVSDLIYRQNGTLSTSMRELVLNAFDAGSESVDISIWPKGFRVTDTGSGFKDKKSILRDFKRFGHPHKEGDAMYGRFRIGRGQVMAFAKTTWYSNTFKMTTDLSSGGELGFTLKENQPFLQGCEVSGEFYKAVDSFDLMRAIEDLSDLVRYAPFPVTINQTLATVGDRTKWDYEDDRIKISFEPKGRHGVFLYSKGILVKELQLHRYGVSADIVTKESLNLNMARNEISDDDELWKHAHSTLLKEMSKRERKKTKLTDSARKALIQQFLEDELDFDEAIKLPLLKDSRGRSTTLLKQLDKKQQWSVTTSENSKVAEFINRRALAFVLYESELSLWGCGTVEEFRTVLMKLTSRHPTSSWGSYVVKKLAALEVIDFSELKVGVNNSYELIKLKDLSPLEKAQRNTLQYTANSIAKRLSTIHQEDTAGRNIHVGNSHALAWTDSNTYIAINRNMLDLFQNGYAGLAQLALTLVHEYTHQEGSISTNEHDLDFYERFHDSLLVNSVKDDVIGNAITSLRTKYKRELEKAGLPYPKWIGENHHKTIRFNLSTSKPTALLEWVLAAFELPIKKGRGWFDLTLTTPSTHELSEKLEKATEKFAKTTGVKLPLIKEFDYILDWDTRLQKYKQARFDILANGFTQHGFELSEAAVKALANLRDHRSRSALGILELLTDHDDFGVVSLEHTMSLDTKILSGREFSFHMNTPSFRYYRSKELTAKGLSEGGSQERFKVYDKVLYDLISSIKCPKEKDEYLNRVFTEDMIHSLEAMR